MDYLPDGTSPDMMDNYVNEELYDNNQNNLNGINK